jgi:hypothetical protein
MLTPDAEYLSSWQVHGFSKSGINIYTTAVAVRASTGR